MAIEINGQTPHTLTGSANSAQTQVKRNEPTASQQETGRPSSLDTVSLTDAAKGLNQLEARLAEQPVVDVQRVDDIRNQLTKGTFPFDSTRVAEKLMSFEFQLSA